MPDKWAQYAEPKPSGDRWAQYAESTPSQTDSSAPTASSGQPSNTFDRMRSNLANNTTDPTPTGGFWHDNVLTPMVHVANRVGQNVANPLIDFAQDVHDPADVVAARRTKQGEAAFNASPLSPDYKGSAAAGAAELMGNAVPLAPGAGTQIRGYANSKTPISDMAGDAATAGLFYGATKTFPRTSPVEALRQGLSASADKPIPGSGGLTPRSRFNSAENLGVSLDAADATNNPFLNTVKRVNENSLFGSGQYETNRANNIAALNQATNKTLDAMSPYGREVGGQKIQTGLKANQAALKTGAADEFADLSKQTGNAPVAGAAQVGQQARSFLDQTKPLYDQYPSLAPKKALSVLEDLGQIGKQNPPARTSFLDAPGSEFAVPPAQSSAVTPPNWGELQQMRSAVHDIYSNNPDLVQSHGNGMLQSMVGGIDDAMTNGKSGLTPTQQDQFRDANAGWKEMKETYDNPSSPFYHAVRSSTPSTLAEGIGPRTAEMMRNVSNRVGPEGVGAIQRGVTTKALGTTQGGDYNFRNFGGNLNKIPADYRAELFSPPQASTLSDIGNTSNALTKDFNPSGSAKMGQKVAEGAALFHPLTAAPVLAQWPAAKFMNSPAAVDWLMRSQQFNAPINPAIPAAAAYAGLYAGQKKR